MPPAEARLEETGIFLVMAFELLVGSGKIRGGGQLRRRMEKKLKILKKGFNDAGGKGMEMWERDGEASGNRDDRHGY